MGDEQIWYIFQDAQQTGPYEEKHIRESLQKGDIAGDAYLFKVGWKDWRPVEDCTSELGTSVATSSASTTDRRTRAPRATIKGRVIVHNNGQLVIGGGVNISSSGIFVETPDLIFNVGETLKLTCRVDGFLKAFNVTAKVMRFNSDKRFPIGYGLKFSALDQVIALEIQRLVDQANSAGPSSFHGDDQH